MRRAAILSGLLAPAIFLGGCSGTLQNGRGWGQDAPAKPQCSKMWLAAKNAFFCPEFLVPAAGAAAFYFVDDWDDRVSDWATKHNPIFGSEDTARTASDVLVVLLGADALGTAVCASSGDDVSRRDCKSTCGGLLVEGEAWLATYGITHVLKEHISRSRPDRDDDYGDSFPSGHTASAFSFATLANRNLESIRLPQRWGVSDGWQKGVKVVNFGLAAGAGWARIEGKKHYPSDVLAGAALGYGVTTFIHDAFMGLPVERRFRIGVSPQQGGGMLNVYWNF